MSTLERLVMVLVGLAAGSVAGFYIHMFMLPEMPTDPMATGRAQGVWIACTVAGGLWMHYHAKRWKPRPKGQPLPTLPSQRPAYRYGENGHDTYLERIWNPRKDTDGR